MLLKFEQYEKELDVYKNVPITKPAVVRVKNSRIILIYFLMTTSVIQIKTKTTEY